MRGTAAVWPVTTKAEGQAAMHPKMCKDVVCSEKLLCSVGVFVCMCSHVHAGMHVPKSRDSSADGGEASVM